MKNITAIAHVALKVKDIERSLAFYRTVLEFKEMLRLENPVGGLFLVYLRVTDTQYLELFPDAVGDQAPGADAMGVHHFCLEVDNLDDAVRHLIEKGADTFVEWIQGEVQVSPSPVVNTGRDGNRQCWMIDPDGNRIELMEMGSNSLQRRAIQRLRGE
ncbi:VOC family protein [Devosia sp. SL43]|uniref:VOC family protein n=1 Tax=Devosia sp. SL43 TaxID=2806348 RepID=UPI001F4174AF|nr:VOC family protein [Devosia sp. SL43]UJW86516.1 VOC family protein [Devosia sp. SL43]